MKKKYFDVGIYYNHQRTETITFKRRWEQWVFHALLNRSTFHQGTTESH